MSSANSRSPDRQMFSRSCSLSLVKTRMPLRPREIVTYHCCRFVAGLTAESENKT